MSSLLSTTIDGVINETFGPFGGIVSSFTTGFFKRGKENKENLTANEIQVEQSKELLSELTFNNFLANQVRTAKC